MYSKPKIAMTSTSKSDSANTDAKSTNTDPFWKLAKKKPEIVIYTQEMFEEDHRRFNALTNSEDDAQVSNEAEVQSKQDADRSASVADQSGDAPPAESEQNPDSDSVENDNQNEETENETSDVTDESVVGVVDADAQDTIEQSSPECASQSTIVADTDSKNVPVSYKPENNLRVSADVPNRGPKKEAQKPPPKLATPTKRSLRPRAALQAKTNISAANSAKNLTSKKKAPISSSAVGARPPKQQKLKPDTPSAATRRSGRLIKPPTATNSLKSLKNPTLKQIPASKRKTKKQADPSKHDSSSIAASGAPTSRKQIKKKTQKKPQQPEKKEEDELICQQCGRFFADQAALADHHLGVHQAERPFQCPDCSWAFRAGWELTEHRVVHSSERNFRCDQCPAAFRRRSNLVAHGRVHTTERAFGCLQCPRAFKFSQGLRRHRRSAHSKARPLACRPCGSTFKLRCDLTRHRHAFHAAEDGPKSRRLKCRFCDRWFPVRLGGEGKSGSGLLEEVDDGLLAEHQHREHSDKICNIADGR